MKHVLFPLVELPAGRVRAVVHEGTALAVVHAPDGEVYALRDRCPHLGTALSSGQVTPKVTSAGVGQPVETDEFVLRCPWHGHEFSLNDGTCPAAPDKIRVKRFNVSVEDGMVVLIK